MRILLGLSITILLSACGGSSAAVPAGAPARTATTTPIPTAATTVTPTAKATPTPATIDAAQEICTVSNGGTFYLFVTSASEHDFRACAGDTLYSGTIDDLLKMPTVDRRCIADSNANIAQFHALVAVYSDQNNVKAANDFCQSLGATMG